MINPIDNNIINYSANAKMQEAGEEDFQNVLNKAMSEKDDTKLKKACKDMEAIFINLMFKQMRSTVDKSGLMDGGDGNFAEETYEDMLFENYANEASKGEGLGLSDIMYKQLSAQMHNEKTGGQNDK